MRLRIVHLALNLPSNALKKNISLRLKKTRGGLRNRMHETRKVFWKLFLKQDRPAPTHQISFSSERRYKDLISQPFLHGPLFTLPFSFICISICPLCIFQTTSEPELRCFFMCVLFFPLIRNAGLWWKAGLKGEMSKEGKRFKSGRRVRGATVYCPSKTIQGFIFSLD